MTVAVAVAAVVGGCTGARPHPAPGPVRPTWHEVRLPAATGRATVLALTTCGRRWYATGALTDARGGTRPAAWTSPDATAWTPLAVRPRYAYGPTQTLTAAACTGGSLVALGGVSGGVHGNLRISSWLSTGGGPLVEQPAGLELYGGNEQIDTSRAVAGPRGFLLVGDRAPAGTGPGGAVWVSRTGTPFTLVDRDPALGWSPARSTAASGATALPGGDWLVVGSLSRPGHLAQRVPAAWRSADGLRWRQVTPAGTSPGPPADGAASDGAESGDASGAAASGGAAPGGRQDEAFEQVTVVGDRALAVGPSGDGFAAWWSPAADPGTWHRAGRIVAFGGTKLPQVAALTTVDGTGPVAALDTGRDVQLWAGDPADTGAWRPVVAPVTVPAGPGHRLLVAAAGRRMLLVATGDSGTRLWTADLT